MTADDATPDAASVLALLVAGHRLPVVAALVLGAQTVGDISERPCAGTWSRKTSSHARTASTGAPVGASSSRASVEIRLIASGEQPAQ
jgi:hypothetical protein